MTPCKGCLSKAWETLLCMLRFGRSSSGTCQSLDPLALIAHEAQLLASSSCELQHLALAGGYEGEWGRNKTINKKTHKQLFSQDCPGTIRGLSRDCPIIFLRFPGNFVCVFPFSPKKRATHKQIWPPQFPGESQEVVHLYGFCAPRGEFLSVPAIMSTPPGEKITKGIRPESFVCSFRGDYGKTT